ncbi:hypothetical protein ABZ801_15855 [Actinomadura sp. NPDC047616]|uniref:hypothetical protein n=1 Tax=Actinomadura sp. NPDC047616 TaxID=3155914 RepID=UPI0033D39F58
MLLLSEAVDNWVVTGLLQEFGGKRLQSVAQGVPDFGDLADEASGSTASRTTRAWPTGPTSCSPRPSSPSARVSTTRPTSSPVSTISWWT